MKILKERCLELLEKDKVKYDVALRLFEEMQICVEILHDGPKTEEGKLIMDYDLRQVENRYISNRVILTKIFGYDSVAELCDAINEFTI